MAKALHSPQVWKAHSRKSGIVAVLAGFQAVVALSSLIRQEPWDAGRGLRKPGGLDRGSGRAQEAHRKISAGKVWFVLPHALASPYPGCVRQDRQSWLNIKGSRTWDHDLLRGL